MVFAFGSAAVAFVLGASLAWLVERTNVPLAQLFIPLAVVPLILPGVLEGRMLSAAWLGLALLLVVWVATALASVPMHARLEQDFDPAAHAWLVRGNWIRTAAWSARLVLIICWLRPRG